MSRRRENWWLAEVDQALNIIAGDWTALQKKDVVQILQGIDRQPSQIAREADFPCNFFAGSGAVEAWDVFDFVGNPFKKSVEMSQFAERSYLWKRLGTADRQEVLEKAQSRANWGYLVLAILPRDPPAGHVAIILPGDLVWSGKWKKDVPVTAQWKHHDRRHLHYIRGAKSLIPVGGRWVGGGTLANSFAPKDAPSVVIYWRLQLVPPWWIRYLHLRINRLLKLHSLSRNSPD